MNKILIFSTLSLAFLFLNGCGVKPSQVKPPEHKASSLATYPAAETVQH